jgi:peptidoglycan hydrolase CwlO-like protein
MLLSPISEIKPENESSNQARKLGIEARVKLLYEEIDANEEENRHMESEIAKLEKELETLNGSISHASQKK